MPAATDKQKEKITYPDGKKTKGFGDARMKKGRRRVSDGVQLGARFRFQSLRLFLVPHFRVQRHADVDHCARRDQPRFRQAKAGKTHTVETGREPKILDFKERTRPRQVLLFDEQQFREHIGRFQALRRERLLHELSGGALTLRDQRVLPRLFHLRIEQFAEGRPDLDATS